MIWEEIHLKETDMVISTKVLQREENCEHIYEIVVGVFFKFRWLNKEVDDITFRWQTVPVLVGTVWVAGERTDNGIPEVEVKFPPLLACVCVYA